MVAAARSPNSQIVLIVGFKCKLSTSGFSFHPRSVAILVLDFRSFPFWVQIQVRVIFYLPFWLQGYALVGTAGISLSNTFFLNFISSRWPEVTLTSYNTSDRLVVLNPLPFEWIARRWNSFDSSLWPGSSWLASITTFHHHFFFFLSATRWPSLSR